MFIHSYTRICLWCRPRESRRSLEYPVIKKCPFQLTLPFPALIHLAHSWQGISVPYVFPAGSLAKALYLFIAIIYNTLGTIINWSFRADSMMDPGGWYCIQSMPSGNPSSLGSYSLYYIYSKTLRNLSNDTPVSLLEIQLFNGYHRVDSVTRWRKHYSLTVLVPTQL